MLRESYILVYKLVVMRLIAVEYIRVGRTGIRLQLLAPAVAFLRESYILVYTPVVMGLIVVEYIIVGRTGVNVHSISIKV